MARDSGRAPSAPGSHEPSPDGLGPSGFDPSRRTRPEKWKRFDSFVNRPTPAPAFLQEITVGGLWSVQVFVPPTRKANFSPIYRLFCDPPQDTIPYDGYYNGWPGDKRGWMRFQTKEEARDFYKFATGRMPFEEYRQRDRAPISMVRIDLDENGDFAQGIVTEGGDGVAGSGPKD